MQTDSLCNTHPPECRKCCKVLCQDEPSGACALWRCCFSWHIPGVKTVGCPREDPLSVRMPMAMAMLTKTTPTTARMATQPVCLPQNSPVSQSCYHDSIIESLEQHAHGSSGRQAGIGRRTEISSLRDDITFSEEMQRRSYSHMQGIAFCSRRA